MIPTTTARRRGNIRTRTLRIRFAHARWALGMSARWYMMMELGRITQGSRRRIARRMGTIIRRRMPLDRGLSRLLTRPRHSGPSKPEPGSGRLLRWEESAIQPSTTLPARPRTFRRGSGLRQLFQRRIMRDPIIVVLNRWSVMGMRSIDGVPVRNILRILRRWPPRLLTLVLEPDLKNGGYQARTKRKKSKGSTYLNFSRTQPNLFPHVFPHGRCRKGRL